MVRNLVLSFLLSTIFVLVVVGEANVRNGKVFSLFNIVTFKNEVCASKTTSTARNGTCYTSTECTDKGGSPAGNCAAGFGVCCVFTITAGSSKTSENNTYIQNPSYPSVYGSTTALTYTINKCSSDICTIRIDFETFTTVGPTTTSEAADTTATDGCTDSFVASGSSGFSSPSICGVNAGQHMYIDVGAASTDTATLTFTFGTATSTIRTWDILVSQQVCGATYAPPPGCLQYHTGLTGYFKTFNYDASVVAHLESQDYSICIRQEAGQCCIRYGACGGADAAFQIGDAGAILLDTSCTEDYVGIDGVSDVCDPSTGLLRSRICGVLSVNGAAMTATSATSTVCDCSAPFLVKIYTDNTADAINTGASDNKGVCLEYTQIPCE